MNRKIAELKQKYDVNNLKEFERAIMSGKIGPKFPGDFAYETDFLTWEDELYKHKKHKNT